MEFHDGRVVLHIGDCFDVLDTLPENSVDAVVTDPPYALVSIQKRFANATEDDVYKNAELRKTFNQGCSPYARAAKGFMGATWDNGQVAFNPELWAKVYRVLKPGGHMVAFGGTRTYHRLVCAIEDAGFEIRDMVNWVYGSGFPKSHDISKAIDRMNGMERKKVRITNVRNPKTTGGGKDGMEGATRPFIEKGIKLGYHEVDGHIPVSEEAKAWEGWGTALKPSHEDICLAQKPYIVEQNINIIGSYLARLEARLWSMLSANVAERVLGLSRQDYDAVCDFAQWNAEKKSNIQDALLGQMDMSQLESATISSLNTVRSWKNTWEELSKPENTSIIETELNTIIDLKTLKSLLLKITPESIIKVHKTGQWLNVHASLAERTFHGVALKLKGTLELFALGNALEKDVGNCREEGEKLTPNMELITLARKPLSEPTIAANVLKWGTGALNIDGCRIPIEERDNIFAKNPHTFNKGENWIFGEYQGVLEAYMPKARWPANFCHDGSDEVLALFPETNPSKVSMRGLQHNGRHGGFGDLGSNQKEGTNTFRGIDDEGGSAARFFYCAKAGPLDRIGSKHPTVKPCSLIRFLVRLITPPGGTVLDMFAGTGTTGQAAMLEGFKSVIIEREKEYVEDIERRMKLVFEKTPLKREKNSTDGATLF